MKNILLLSFFLFLLSCAVKPKGTFQEQTRPATPDYSNPDSWAALPDRKDAADLVPTPDFKDNQATASIDVFFLHPTIYTGKKGENQWNASLQDKELNERIDSTTIKNQATAFNGVGKIYSPRYRQAHLNAYKAYEEPKRKEDAAKAFELAYSDIKAAFQYYLENYNQGRPFIIASHSQGTTHGKRLIRDMIDGTKLQNRLVAAYLVGIQVEKDYFKKLPICDAPQRTGCYCTWRTYQEGFIPKNYTPNNNIAVVNPLSWTTDTDKADKNLNKGAVLRTFSADPIPSLVGARVFDGLLYTEKPKFPGSIFLVTKNYHIADYNFFWVNIRENAAYRERLFWK